MFDFQIGPVMYFMNHTLNHKRETNKVVWKLCYERQLTNGYLRKTSKKFNLKKRYVTFSHVIVWLKLN